MIITKSLNSYHFYHRGYVCSVGSALNYSPFWKVVTKVLTYFEKNENMTLKILKTIARLTKWCLSSHKQNVK